MAGMLLLFLVGTGLALSLLTGRSWRGPAVPAVIGFAFLVTITVVIALFILRPGGNAGTAVVFGGYLALAAIGTVKGGAIVMTANARSRSAAGRFHRVGRGFTGWAAGSPAVMFDS